MAMSSSPELFEFSPAPSSSVIRSDNDIGNDN